MRAAITAARLEVSLFAACFSHSNEQVLTSHRVVLSASHVSLRMSHRQTLYGSEVDRSRWRDCVSYVSDNMGNAVGRLFVEKHFDEAAKTVVSIHMCTSELSHNTGNLLYI